MNKELNHDDRISNRLRQEFKSAKDSDMKERVLKGYRNALNKYPRSSVLLADFEVIKAVYSWELTDTGAEL